MRNRIIIWLFVILLFSVALVQTGRYNFDSDHGIEKTGSNGTAAFATLLKETYKNVSIVEELPKTSDSLIVIPYMDDFEEDLRDLLRTRKAKGVVVLYKITRSDSQSSQQVTVHNYNTEKPLGSLSQVPKNELSFLAEPDAVWVQSLLENSEEYTLLSDAKTNNTLASIERKDGTTLYRFNEAAGIVNSHLAEANNADIFLGFLDSANTSNKPITIVSGYLNSANRRGIVERLGPVFHSAWNQFLVLLGVVFLTLNIRFGKPPEPRPEQRSARELVDGVGNLAKRKDLGRWALQCVYNHTMIELERRHRTSRQQLLNRPEDFLDSEQAATLIRSQNALSIDLSTKDALNLSRQLRRLV